MIDPKIVEELKEKHGANLHIVTAQGVEVVVKVPSKAAYRRFRQSSRDEKRRDDATETLLRDCVVYPDAQTLNSEIEKRPAIVDTFAAEVLELAGLVKEAEVVPL